MALRLEPRNDVAGILRGREQPQLGAGPARGADDLRRRRQNVLDDVNLPVGLGQRRSAGSPVVEHEGAFVHLGQKAGADEAMCEKSRHHKNCAGAEHPSRVAEHFDKRPLVANRELVDLRRDSRENSPVHFHLKGTAGKLDLGSRIRVLLPEVLRAQQRNDREREHQRDEHGDGQRQRQSREKLSDDALKKSERCKDDDRRDRGRRHRPDDLGYRLPHGDMPIRIEPQMSHDVLGDHHRVVDHEADGDRHRAERHQVEGLADERHDPDRDRHGERNRRRADRGYPQVSQKDEQHENRQGGPDEHCVADRLDRVAHQSRLIVDRLEMHARRKTLRHGRRDAGDAVGDRDGVAAHLARDVEKRRGLSVAGDDLNVVLCSRPHDRDVVHANAPRQDDLADFLRGMRLLRSNDQILSVVLRQTSNGRDSG